MKAARVKDLIDFDLMGIISAAKPHKLAWILNNECSLELTKNSTVELTSKEGVLLAPVCYEFHSDYTSYYLFYNKVTQGEYTYYLIKGLKNFDYFIITKDQTTHALNDLQAALTSCSCVEYHSKLIPNRISGIEVFIF